MLMFDKQTQAGRYGKKKMRGKPTKNKQPEALLQGQCEDLLMAYHLTFLRIPDNLWRFVQATAPIHIKKQLSVYLKGLPDLTILLKSGQYICVELKSAKGKMTQGQRHFAETVKNYHVIRSVEDFVQLLQDYKAI